MMRYALTDVSVHGAATTHIPDRTNALSAYVLMRADPTVVYAQLVEDGKIIRQFARHADTVQNLELEA